MELNNPLLHALLVACDQSYNPNPSGALNEFPDSQGEGANSPPNTMPTNWQVDLQGWVAHKRYYDPDTGFGAVIYKKPAADGKYDYIVAMQGTRGPNPQDLHGDLTYGWEKFIAEGGGSLLMDDLLGVGQNEILSTTNQIHFTGQSLGGALAEYAAYRYVDRRRELNPSYTLDQISLTSFNGLGGVEALSTKYAEKFGKAFNPLLLNGVATAHYWITNDLVNRLGGGHINGGSSLLLKNTYYQAGEDILDEFNNVVGTAPGFYRQGAIAETHRIETGFYRFFQDNPAGLSAAVPYTVSYLDEEAGRAIGAAFANFLNDNDHPPAESWPRTIAAIASAQEDRHRSHIRRHSFG